MSRWDSDAGVPVEVSAYSGARGEQEPSILWYGGRRLKILDILERWIEPAGRFFRVSTDDGHVHLLFCRERDLTWWLALDRTKLR